ncbi:MAG: alpha-E domain-containing protein [Actinobacteria bacterium]|nr:alpha-E domain-containing protein [Actinomycetota bacterium]
MLSRIAESLFWVGRYVERADDTARILDVHVHDAMAIEAGEDNRHRELLEVMGVPTPTGDLGAHRLTHLLALDPDNPGSIVSSLAAARENARGARESISAEMWEALNASWHALPTRVGAVGVAGAHGFFRFVKDGAALFSGLADSTMSQDDGWRFLVLGRSVERVDMMSRLLSSRVGEATDAHDWLTLLTSCSGYEAYLRSSQREVAPEPVVQFLLLDRLFPRSILHALITADRCLVDLDRMAHDGKLDEARRILAQARTRLEYEPLAETLASLGVRLRGLQDACSSAGEAIAQRWFRQSQLTAGAAEGAAAR